MGGWTWTVSPRCAPADASGEKKSSNGGSKKGRGHKEQSWVFRRHGRRNRSRRPYVIRGPGEALSFRWWHQLTNDSWDARQGRLGSSSIDLDRLQGDVGRRPAGGKNFRNPEEGHGDTYEVERLLRVFGQKLAGFAPRAGVNSGVDLHAINRKEARQMPADFDRRGGSAPARRR